MRKLALISTVVVTSWFILPACQKDNELSGITGNVDLYLIESFETKSNTCQIINSTVKTQDAALIPYSDLLSYDSAIHIFKLSNEALQTIQNREYAIDGQPFAIKVDDEIVYTGYFWPAYSSAICDWIVIDPVLVEIENAMKVRLGYPGLLEGMTIPDKRNDNRIIEIFRRDGKLVE